jgi:hypothetical protein
MLKKSGDTYNPDYFVITLFCMQMYLYGFYDVGWLLLTGWY